MGKLLYSVEGFAINDSWYEYKDGKYYAYFLQYPFGADESQKWENQSVGVSVSEDLKKWEYKGTVLEPDKNKWYDRGIATGSTIKKDGTYYMLFTGKSLTGAGGLGIVKTNDMFHFEDVVDRPVISKEKTYKFKYKDTFVECAVLADPYIFEKQIDGWYYVYINCYAVERKIGQRGCIAVMRTKNLIDYEPYNVAFLSDDYDRLETPQVFVLENKLFMYLGAVKSRIDQSGNLEDYYRVNKFLTGSEFTGEFFELQDIVLPDSQDFYIGKTVYDKNKKPYFIGNYYPDGCCGLYNIKFDNENNKINVF